MNSNNPGSKPGFNLSDWLRPTRSADSNVVPNRVRPATSSQATRRKASHEDSDDEDDFHPALDNTALDSALAALKAGNEAAALRKSGGRVHTPAPTPARRDPPPHLETPTPTPHPRPPLQQSVLPFSLSTSSLAGLKRKDVPTAASHSPTAAAPANTTDSPPPATRKSGKRLQKRAKPPVPQITADTPFDIATQHLRNSGMFRLIGKMDLQFVTNSLFKIAARLQDTGTSELLHALATIQNELLLRQASEQATTTLRDAAKEISGNLAKKLDDLSTNTLVAIKQGVLKASRELDKSTDILKVTAGNLKATTEHAPKSFANVVAANAPLPPSPHQTLLQPSTQARLERDRRRILVDPPTSKTPLYPATVGAIRIAKEATEALHRIGGKPAWAFVGCTKLEKGGILLEANLAAAKEWITTEGRLEDFVAAFSPGATIREKKYTVKALYLPVEHSIDDEETCRNIEEENDLPPHSIILIKWMKPAERRGKNQQFGHATITFNSPSSANLILRQGLLFMDTNYRCHKCKVEPLRCLKCQNYGHIASGCTATSTTCATCAQQHDEDGDCPQLFRKEAHACIACRTGGHASWERTCPSRLKLQRALDERLESNRLPFFPTEEPWTQRCAPLYSGRVSTHTLLDCDWQQSKKIQPRQTSIADSLKPRPEAALTRRPHTRHSPGTDWADSSWDPPMDQDPPPTNNREVPHAR
ncbi:hypothetical protein PC9H_005865 [Pleurotus ostreatus]|uniref:CCHC-type domain-containing protein n=1 Tax=Pleurotus ostreatus TaxID=5322 RepID=A0A8H6ZVM0_PLEOS|nr:uncharacterized protein PC9H_005865 [Pleurotus ostreatus]KAF7430165.1 hypothetical protein PC9H_005865 [Pleurotus ostreatus]